MGPKSHRQLNAPRSAKDSEVAQELLLLRDRERNRLARGFLNVIEGCSGKKTEQTEHKLEHKAPPDIKEILLGIGWESYETRVGMSIQS